MAAVTSMGLGSATWLVLAGMLGCTSAGAGVPDAPTSPVPEAIPCEAPTTLEDGSSEVLPVLEFEHVSRVVSAANPHIQARCWQPALDERADDAPRAVRLFVRAVVGPSGAVTSVETSENPSGYPQLSDCIASVVRSPEVLSGAERLGGHHSVRARGAELF